MTKIRYKRKTDECRQALQYNQRMFKAGRDLAESLQLTLKQQVPNCSHLFTPILFQYVFQIAAKVLLTHNPHLLSLKLFASHCPLHFILIPSPVRSKTCMILSLSLQSHPCIHCFRQLVKYLQSFTSVPETVPCTVIIKKKSHPPPPPVELTL